MGQRTQTFIRILAGGKPRVLAFHDQWGFGRPTILKLWNLYQFFQAARISNASGGTQFPSSERSVLGAVRLGSSTGTAFLENLLSVSPEHGVYSPTTLEEGFKNVADFSNDGGYLFVDLTQESLIRYAFARSRGDGKVQVEGVGPTQDYWEAHQNTGVDWEEAYLQQIDTLARELDESPSTELLSRESLAELFPVTKQDCVATSAT